MGGVFGEDSDEEGEASNCGVKLLYPSMSIEDEDWHGVRRSMLIYTHLEVGD